MTEEDCGSDEASEPEEHCQALHTTDDPRVCKALELPRCEAEIDQGEERPDRTEDQEVDLRLRASVTFGG